MIELARWWLQDRVVGRTANAIDRLLCRLFHRHRLGETRMVGPPWDRWTVRWCEQPWRGRRCGHFERLR